MAKSLGRAQETMSDRRLQYFIRFCSILKQPEKAIGEARSE
jgi:hypothetical protein